MNWAMFPSTIKEGRAGNTNHLAGTPTSQMERYQERMRGRRGQGLVSLDEAKADPQEAASKGHHT